MESDPSQLAAYFENNSMLVGCYLLPFKFPKNLFIIENLFNVVPILHHKFIESS